jgi:hypothetical protein
LFKAGDQGHESSAGTWFKKAGRDLELLPAHIRAEATKWIDQKVEDAIANYEPEDPRDMY